MSETLEQPARSADELGSRGVTDLLHGDAVRTPENANQELEQLQAAPSRLEGKPVRVVASRVALGPRLKEIWDNRELIVVMVRTHLRVKYQGSVLGFLWSMLNPALVLGVYYVVFQIILKNGIPNYAVFLFAGLVVWNLFSTVLMDATSTIVNNSGIVKKVAFPREILALSSVGVGVVFFVLQTIVLVIVLVALRSVPAVVFLPEVVLGFVVLVVFTSALAVFLSALNVYYRDTRHLVEVLLVAWFWGVPVVYSFQDIALKFANHPALKFLEWIYLADPPASIVLAFQRALYAKVNAPSTVAPHPILHLLPVYGPLWYAVVLGIMLVVSVGLLLGALVFFGHLEGNFAEVM